MGRLPLNTMAKLSLVALGVFLLFAVVRQWPGDRDGMVYFAADRVVLGGEAHPLLEQLRDKTDLTATDVADVLPKSQTWRPTKRLFFARHEIKNRQYQQLAFQLRANPRLRKLLVHGDVPAGHEFESSAMRDAKYNNSEQPAINLDWFEADAYCRFVGMRLPTAQEFEALFRFEASLRKPREFDLPVRTKVTVAGELGMTTEEQVIPNISGRFVSAKGIFHDVIGNVMEWTQPERGRHFLMGYSFKQYGEGDSRDQFNPWRRTYAKSDSYQNDYGARCVFEVENPTFMLDTRRAPTVNRDGVQCWHTRFNLGSNRFNLVNGFNAAQASGGAIFPDQLCELPNRDYQLGPDLNLTTVELLQTTPSGYAGYLLGETPEAKTMGAFWLDRREVSVAEYARFLEQSEAKRSLSRHPEAPQRQLPAANWQAQQALVDQSAPVTGVDWWSAFAYCRYHNKRLPFADEWERAARGPQNRVYPWGDSVDGAVGDMTAEGVSGLGRSVSEWTATFVPGTNAAVVKGGSEHFDWRVFGRAYAKLSMPRDTASSAVGFRCAQGLHR